MYWIAIGVIGYGRNYNGHSLSYRNVDMRVFGGLGSKGISEVNYVNTISHKITAKQSLREDAVGLYGTQYTGTASYYGQAFAGRTTACGDTFDPSANSAASLRHDCGTILNVCLSGSSRCVVVVVNDTGNFEVLGRVLDLSSGAFEKLAPLSQGLVSVRIEEELDK